MLEPLEQLVAELTKLPSVGRKSAWRLAMHILDKGEKEAARLGEAIANLPKRVGRCSSCGAYAEEDLCELCRDSRRDRTLICIVEKPMDIFAFEKSGTYNGLYHVLGGLISPINGITPDRLSFQKLETRIQSGEPRELIIGLGGSSEAETTATYIFRLFKEYSLTITRLARGLPAGSELEFVDPLTLSRALSDRTDVS